MTSPLITTPLMTLPSWILLGVFFTLLVLAAWPLGLWLTRVADGRFPAPLSRAARIEGRLFRIAGVDAKQGMGWKTYALAILLFNLIGVLAVYGLQRLQLSLPLNPQGMAGVSPDSAFNTAISFVSNTNWQGYAGEATMSYLTQMLALTVQNFLSAATGIAVLFALVRGIAARSSATLGNAWVDLVRITVYVLLPLSAVFALVLISQGVVQNFDPYLSANVLQGDAVQSIAMGPVASQEAIKMLGTNGGGFFNANSAHPFENPTAPVNLLQMLAIFLIPTALCFMFGKLVGDLRQAWAVLVAMTLIFVVVAVGIVAAEQQGNPAIAALGVDQAYGMSQSGGNMEGKETRFGIGGSALFAAVTTAASCGAVNAMHDSFTPLGGMGPMVLMQLGEVVFGGVGTGLYGMLVVAIVAVFLAGLMIGRTPEYLGKKIEPFEMKMAAIALLVAPVLTLVGTALASVLPDGLAGLANPGAHGFSEMLYALTSAANNNGSAFAGLSANTPFYNILLGIAMWFGRFAVIVAVLALAGSLAAKKRVPVTVGTLPTHGPLFVTLLVGTVVLIGLLNFVPALALGPIAEHLLLMSGR